MERTELIKGILKMVAPLEKSEGVESVMIITEMERLVDKYVSELNPNY